MVVVVAVANVAVADVLVVAVAGAVAGVAVVAGVVVSAGLFNLASGPRRSNGRDT